ncbi:MAG: DUF4293 family protein [Bacteroidetes bacterium]|nr:MAG: DUF4293 family protein [Bacteroidota bacterium]
MIQRIQTLFLLLAAAAGGGLFLPLPLARTPQPQPGGLFSDGLLTVTDDVLLSVLLGLGGGLAFAAIFLFRNRPLQIRLTGLAFLVGLAGLGLGLYHFFTQGQAAAAEPALGLALPVLFAVLCLLAIRFIRKDEELVRSMDRLR